MENNSYSNYIWRLATQTYLFENIYRDGERTEEYIQGLPDTMRPSWCKRQQRTGWQLLLVSASAAANLLSHLKPQCYVLGCPEQVLPFLFRAVLTSFLFFFPVYWMYSLPSSSGKASLESLEDLGSFYSCSNILSLWSLSTSLSTTRSCFKISCTFVFVWKAKEMLISVEIY